jgi:hypothetical protein
MLCAARMLFQLETSCACQWPWRWPLQSPLVNRSSRRHVVRVRDTTAHLGIARNKVTAVTHGKQITCLPVAPSIPVVPLPPHLFCTRTAITRSSLAHPRQLERSSRTHLQLVTACKTSRDRRRRIGGGYLSDRCVSHRNLIPLFILWIAQGADHSLANPHRAS